MEQQLQLKPFKKTPGFRYKILHITDITFHTSHKQPSNAIAKNVNKSLHKTSLADFMVSKQKIYLTEKVLLEYWMNMLKKIQNS